MTHISIKRINHGSKSTGQNHSRERHGHGTRNRALDKEYLIKVAHEAKEQDKIVAYIMSSFTVRSIFRAMDVVPLPTWKIMPGSAPPEQMRYGPLSFESGSRRLFAVALQLSAYGLGFDSLRKELGHVWKDRQSPDGHDACARILMLGSSAVRSPA